MALQDRLASKITPAAAAAPARGTAAPEDPPKERIKPNLNRPKVANWSDGAALIGWDDNGVFRLALRAFQYKPGGRNNPHYLADWIVLESDHAKWPVGRTGSHMFHVGRQGTKDDPGRADRDDAYLDGFIRAVFRKQRGEAFDSEAALEELIADAKFETDDLSFVFRREAGKPKKYEVKHPQTGAVLDTYEKSFAQDKFEVDPAFFAESAAAQ